MDEIRREAERFVSTETQFHLGALPTEQSHPATRGLAEITAADTAAGIRLLQGVDQDVVATARRVAASAEYQATVELMVATLTAGGRICFSGCGATGRLSIQLEATWRAFWRETAARLGRTFAAGEQVTSLMTGGDFALVRSVESFEDYASFGREQVRAAGLGAGDLLVAVTEGGETSSVIGTAWEALEAGARVVFACNNPMEVLAAHVERSRQVIADARILNLDLSSGPMAVAGSTRMQATTAELLVLGAALDEALRRYLAEALPAEAARWAESTGFPERFAALLESLAAPAAVAAMAAWVGLEASLYAAGGAVTYYADAWLLDIFTDTTERAPTFSLPPFRKHDDPTAARPWAFVKNPLYPTPETWRRMLGREPRCLEWEPATYRRLGGSEAMVAAPPALSCPELFRFLVGHESEPSRRERPYDLAALVSGGSELATLGDESGLGRAFASAAEPFGRRAALLIGEGEPAVAAEYLCRVPCTLPASPLRLWEHLGVKLVLNTISTATAARLGRLVSNWMAYVETTNKKLIDRGTRLVAELANVEYAAACYELHLTRHLLAAEAAAGLPRRSPVAVTLERLGWSPGEAQR